MKNWTVLVLKAMVLGNLFLSFFKTHPYTDPCLKVRDHNFVGFGSKPCHVAEVQVWLSLLDRSVASGL